MEGRKASHDMSNLEKDELLQQKEHIRFHTLGPEIIEARQLAGLDLSSNNHGKK